MKLPLMMVIFLTSLLFGANAQRGDFSIVIAAPAETVQLNGTTAVTIHTCNNGEAGNNYVANSLRITLSVGTNVEITGINTGASDARWRQLSLTSGSNNTIRISNAGGTMQAGDCADIVLNVKGKAISNSAAITSNIGFITAFNPLLGAPNATQGNISAVNDNSVTTLAVTSAARGLGAFPNPARNTITVTGITAGDNILLTDIYGNTLQQNRASGTNVETMNISQYANGQYLLKIVNGSGSKTIIVPNNSTRFPNHTC